MSELQANTLKPRSGSTIQIGTTGSHTLAVGDASNAADLDVKGSTQLRGGLDCEGVAEFDSAVTIDSSLATTGNITVTGGDITAAEGRITCDTLAANNITGLDGASVTPIFAGGAANYVGSNWVGVSGTTVGGTWSDFSCGWWGLSRCPRFTFDTTQADANYMVFTFLERDDSTGAAEYIVRVTLKNEDKVEFGAVAGQFNAIFVRLV